MDSQHRHDLEENDLQEFFLNFRDWWERWGTTVMIVITVLCVAGAVYVVLHQRSKQAYQSAWNDLGNSTSPQTLEKVASKYSQKTVKILASLRSGDLYLAQYLSPASASAAASQPSPEASPKADLDHAEAMYHHVLTLADQPIYKLNALMGLANVAENRRLWSEAKNYYQEVERLGHRAGFANFVEEAKTRIDRLPQIQKPLVFAPPATQPATKPTTKSRSTAATKLKVPAKKASPPKPAATPP